jgi:hypothetical protein
MSDRNNTSKREIPIDNGETANTSLSIKDIHLKIDKIQWKKYDFFQLLQYYFFSLLTGGFFMLFCFLYPNFKLKFLSIDCLPGFADLAVVTTSSKNEIISETKHYHTSSTSHMMKTHKEHCLLLEIDCIRFCASSLDNYILRQVPLIPTHFHRFFVENYDQTVPSNDLLDEYSILVAQYGYNKMKVPEQTFAEIGIRHLLSPFYLFQYFAVIVWYIEAYWLFASLILVITLSAVYFTTQESVYNLKQLRELVGSHKKVDVMNSKYRLLKQANRGRRNGGGAAEDDDMDLEGNQHSKLFLFFLTFLFLSFSLCPLFHPFP